MVSSGTSTPAVGELLLLEFTNTQLPRHLPRNTSDKAGEAVVQVHWVVNVANVIRRHTEAGCCGRDNSREHSDLEHERYVNLDPLDSAHNMYLVPKA